jgi:hypothetical protein
MPRQPKPCFRKQTQSWYFSSGGGQINLGKDRKAAFDRFHELMADKETLRSGVTSVYEMSQVYLDWCQGNRKPATYARHCFYLKSFIDFVGKKINVSISGAVSGTQKNSDLSRGLLFVVCRPSVLDVQHSLRETWGSSRFRRIHL